MEDRNELRLKCPYCSKIFSAEYLFEEDKKYVSVYLGQYLLEHWKKDCEQRMN